VTAEWARQWPSEEIWRARKVKRATRRGAAGPSPSTRRSRG
jgi:hypothetical protein